MVIVWWQHYPLEAATAVAAVAAVLVALVVGLVRIVMPASLEAVVFNPPMPLFVHTWHCLHCQRILEIPSSFRGVLSLVSSRRCKKQSFSLIPEMHEVGEGDRICLGCHCAGAAAGRGEGGGTIVAQACC